MVMSKKSKISVDEFLSKRSPNSDGMLYRASAMPRSFDEKSRSAKFIMSDDTLDSYGDSVIAKGCDLSRMDKNPVALLNHNHDKLIGTWSDVAIKGKKVEGQVTLAAEGTSPHVDESYSLLAQGILRAASVGFMPTKVERILDDDGEPTWGYKILEWLMYECSIVTVGANPATLAKAANGGSKTAMHIIEDVLDNYAKNEKGLIVPIMAYEAAQKEATGNKTSVSVDFDGSEFIKNAKAVCERMEAAADRVEKASSAQAEVEVDAEPDPIVKMLEEGTQQILEDAETKLAEIPEDDEERRGPLMKIIDSIKAAFTTTPPEPVKADPEKVKALNERAARIRDRQKAA